MIQIFYLQQSYMKIVRSIPDDGNLAPSAVNYLVNVPDTCLHHEAHGLRHPFSIYHVSLRAITEAFADVIQEYNHQLQLYVKEPEVKFYKNLLRAQRELLYRLREHIDDCYSIFKTLVEPAQVTKKVTFTDKYLRAAKFTELDAFNDSLRPYKEGYLSPLVNSLKHTHARLQGFYFNGPSEIRIGYYLEEMGKDMVVGPSTRIHKDGNSAFSFSRDILFNLFAVYQISEQLVGSMKRFLRQNYNLDLSPSKQDGYDEIKQVVFSASDIAQEFFPDELLKPCAEISVESDSAESRCSLSYPMNPREDSFPAGLRMACFMYPDSKSRNFKLPYTGMRDLKRKMK
jgi:hypothetical protein